MNLFIFNWRIIAVKYCVGFCHLTKWSDIGIHMSPPSWTSLPPSTPFPFNVISRCLSLVQFSCSVMSDSLRPHGLQHSRLSCPSPTPGVWSNSCHPVSMSSNHLILCCPLLLPPSIFPSISIFSNKSVLRIRWPKYWSFSFSISPSNEYSGLISFRMDWLDLLAVQGTLRSLHQHHSSKASILRLSAFFIVQLSHPYMTTGKMIALTRLRCLEVFI